MAAHTRRSLLQATASVLATGLGGCQLRHTDENETGEAETVQTLSPGQTYTIEVENEITADDLKPVEGVPVDAPATVTVEAAAKYDEGDETLFAETIDVSSGEQRTVQDAFSTVPDGPQYVVSAALEQFRESDPAPKYSLTSAHRFVPGGFQAPTSDTFRFVARNGGSGGEFGPWINLDSQQP